MTAMDAASLVCLLFIVGLGLWLVRGAAVPVAKAPAPAPARRGFVCIDAALEQQLNAQVWFHEARARGAGLVAVVEVFASSSKPSRVLSELWRSDSQLAHDTLQGIYLVRVDLAKFGPDAVLGLTPYALHGAPLFVAWTPLGQVLPPSALKHTTAKGLTLPLSAYFEDVARGRAHALHAAPPVPVVELARRQASSLAGRTTADEVRKPEGVRPGSPAAVPSSAAAQLANSLQAFLDAAQTGAHAYLSRAQLRCDHSLDSLQQLDAHLDEIRLVAGGNGELPGEHVAPLAVYWGSVVRAHVRADWFADRGADSVVSALGLRLRLQDGTDQVLYPAELVLERASDSDIGLYGHAAALIGRGVPLEADGHG